MNNYRICVIIKFFNRHMNAFNAGDTDFYIIWALLWQPILKLKRV